MKKTAEKFPEIKKLYEQLGKYVKDNTTEAGDYFGDTYSYRLHERLGNMLKEYNELNKGD